LKEELSTSKTMGTDENGKPARELVHECGVNLLSAHAGFVDSEWTTIQSLLPTTWMWDVEYQNCHPIDGRSYGSWTCTPLELDEPEVFPLTIAGAPVVLPVEYQWPPMGGVNPPPDPRPSTLIDCRKDMSLDAIRDVFLTFEGCLGFYLLINGLLQVIVPDEFDTTWAASHLPHKYGGLKVCYIEQNMEPTMLPTELETSKTKPSLGSQNSSFSNLFRSSRPANTSATPSLQINDFIEARRKSSPKEKYSGRIGLNVAKEGSQYLLMSSHVITEAILAKSFFGKGRTHIERLKEDWNQHVEIWAGNEKVSGT
jgi:hypothetical protein